MNARTHTFIFIICTLCHSSYACSMQSNSHADKSILSITSSDGTLCAHAHMNQKDNITILNAQTNDTIDYKSSDTIIFTTYYEDGHEQIMEFNSTNNTYTIHDDQEKTSTTQEKNKYNLSTYKTIVSALNFNNDGTQLISKENDSICVWSTQNGNLQQRFVAAFDNAFIEQTYESLKLNNVFQ